MSSMADKYTSPVFGAYYTIPANLFFWLWFINFNVAIFNALPIGPLDGGQLYNSLIDKKTQNKKGILRHSSKLLTYGMVIVVVLSIALPYLQVKTIIAVNLTPPFLNYLIIEKY